MFVCVVSVFYLLEVICSICVCYLCESLCLIFLFVPQSLCCSAQFLHLCFVIVFCLSDCMS